jgi:hypothetical protein
MKRIFVFYRSERKAIFMKVSKTRFKLSLSPNMKNGLQSFGLGGDYTRSRSDTKTAFFSYKRTLATTNKRKFSIRA